MRTIVFALLLTITSLVKADTIDNYMNIAGNIPQMELKADPQAQAWARSARHVLTITCESIAETLTQANEAASQHGKALFCLPQGVALNPSSMDEVIQQTYKELASQQSDKGSMTVSQIAFLGVTKHYPCKTNMAANHPQKPLY